VNSLWIILAGGCLPARRLDMEIETTIRDDDLIPSDSREWTETYDDLMPDESWSMDRHTFLEKLSACCSIPIREKPSEPASPLNAPTSS